MAEKNEERAKALRAAINELRAMPEPGTTTAWDWTLLILEMEMVSASTGWGLARTWGFVNDDDYEAARNDMDHILEEWATR